MTSLASDIEIPGDPGRAILDGAIRDALGLTTADLRVGLDVARTMLQRGRVAEAFRTYASLVLCEPANVDFQVGLANCALRLDEHHLALQAASAVVALQPSDPRGYLLSGRACIGLSALAEAREDLTDAAEMARRVGDTGLALEAERLLQQVAALTPS